MIFLGILLSFLAFSCAYAQQEPYGVKDVRNDGAFIALRLSGDATDITLPDTLYTGLILAGTCDSVTIPIINDDPKAITIDTMYLQGGDVADFAILDPASRVIAEIQPGDRFNLLLQFCSTLPECSNTSLFLVVRPTDGSLPVWLYRIKVAGCAGLPHLEIDRSRIEFGDVGIGACGNARFGIRNAGNYPLRIDELLQYGGIPFMIPAREALAGISILPDSIRYVNVQFCPDRPGDIHDTVAVLSSTPGALAQLLLHGRGVASVPELADTMNFGRLLLGTCRDTVLVIRNEGLVPLSITAADLEKSGIDAGFLVTTTVSANQPLVIPAGDTIHLHLRYCPTGTEQATTMLRITMGSGPAYNVVLLGDAVAAIVWLDTTGGTAGDLVRLHARINPGLSGLISITSYRFQLKLRLTALVPKQIIPALPGSTFTMTFDDFGTVVITAAAADSQPADGLLFTLVLRGLSTADPANPVTIEEVSIPGIPELTVAGHGLVLLDGCDISHGGVRISRGLALKSVAPEPGGTRITLLYIAPEDESPTASLYDLSGRLLKSFALEPGTGADQRADIPAGPLHRGPYLLELRTESGRVAAPVMIDQ